MFVSRFEISFPECEIVNAIFSGLFQVLKICPQECYISRNVICVGTKGVSHNHHLSFDDNKVLKLSIGYAKHLFKCAGP